MVPSAWHSNRPLLNYCVCLSLAWTFWAPLFRVALKCRSSSAQASNALGRVFLCRTCAKHNQKGFSTQAFESAGRDVNLTEGCGPLEIAMLAVLCCLSSCLCSVSKERVVGMDRNGIAARDLNLAIVTSVFPSRHWPEACNTSRAEKSVRAAHQSGEWINSNVERHG
eukprot:1084158-Amphidinium_carterae.1